MACLDISSENVYNLEEKIKSQTPQIERGTQLEGQKMPARGWHFQCQNKENIREFCPLVTISRHFGKRKHGGFLETRGHGILMMP